MKRLLILLVALSALPVAAQGTSVDARWLSPTTAEVVWSGPGGPGVCLWRVRPIEGPERVYAEGCGWASGVYRTGVDAREGDTFILKGFYGEVLASDTLEAPPRYEQRLVLVVRPD